ncbi:MAG: arylesterase [Chloroflexota bacterium]
MKQIQNSLCYSVFFLVVVLLAGCGGGETPTPEPTATPTSVPVVDNTITIVAMGDSLTEGFGVDFDQAYPAQLEQRLLADGYDIEVINAGISGETSSGALSRVDWVLTLNPDIVILETGPNDGLRGIDPELTRSNMNALVETFQDNEVVVVLAGMQIVQNMGDAYVEQFRGIYPSVAETYELALIPFFLDGVGGVAELNQADAVHPTAEGYTIVVETVYPYVTDALAEVLATQ